MTRRCWAVAVLVAAMLATAACGSDSSGGSTSGTATPSGQMVHGHDHEHARHRPARHAGARLREGQQVQRQDRRGRFWAGASTSARAARPTSCWCTPPTPRRRSWRRATASSAPGRHAQRLRARRSAVRSREGRRRRRDRPCDAGHRATRSLRSPRAPTTRAPTRRSSSSGSRRASPRRGRGTSRPDRAWDRR